MRCLRLGRLVLSVTDDVARAWPNIAAEALRVAAIDHAPAVVSVRTDRGAIGMIGIRSDVPISFVDEGQLGEPEFGTIIQASADLDAVASADSAARGPDPERPDAEAQAIARKLRAQRPDLEWDNLLMGRLAGPASPDRPAVPVWDYLTFADEHPEVPLSELPRMRFPVRYFGGSWGVTSIDEELRPIPLSYKGPLPKPRFAMTPQTVISRHAALHDAGVVEWHPAECGLVYVQPLGTHRKVLERWVRSLDPLE